MKKKLVFATNNAHKLDEISSILGGKPECIKDDSAEPWI